MDGRQALRPRMGRTARSSREQDRSEGTPQRSAGAGCGAKHFFGYFFGAFAKKVTRRKGERGPINHHKEWISPQSNNQSTNQPLAEVTRAGFFCNKCENTACRSSEALSSSRFSLLSI